MFSAFYTKIRPQFSAGYPHPHKCGGRLSIKLNWRLNRNLKTSLGDCTCEYIGELSNSRLFFIGTFQDRKYTVECPLGSIVRVEKVGGSTSRGENAYGLEIYCKVSMHGGRGRSFSAVFIKCFSYAYVIKISLIVIYVSFMDTDISITCNKTPPSFLKNHTLALQNELPHAITISCIFC